MSREESIRTGSARFVYVLGLPHSGSTLLSLALDTHPQIFSCGELIVFDRYARGSRLCACGRPFVECDVWRGVRDWIIERGDIPDPFEHPGQYAFIPIRKSRISRALRRLRKLGGPRFRTLSHPREPAVIQNYEGLLRAVAGSQGVHVVVDSSKNIELLSSLLRVKSHSWMVIHLVRDCRAYIDSQRRRKGSKVWPAERAARMWASWHREALEILGGLDSRRWLRVRYEDLCLEPDRTLNEICAFLDLEPEDSMKRYSETDHHLIGGSGIRWQASSIRLDERWKSALDQHDLDIYRKEAAHVAREFGYS